MTVTLESYVVLLLLVTPFILLFCFGFYVKHIFQDIQSEQWRAGRAITEVDVQFSTRSAVIPRQPPSTSHQPQEIPTISRTFSNSVVQRRPPRHDISEAGPQQEPSSDGGGGGSEPPKLQSIVPDPAHRSPAPPTSPPSTPRTSQPAQSVHRPPTPGPSRHRADGIAHDATDISISQASRRVDAEPALSLRAPSRAPSSRLSSLTPSPRSSPVPSACPQTPATSPLATTPTSTPKTAISSVTTVYDDSSDDEGFRYRRRSKSKTSNSGGTAARDGGYFKSEASHLMTSPPDASECRRLQVGDVFVHAAKGFNPPKHQVWLWTPSDDGSAYWRPIALGYVRDDGKRLNLSAQKKDPSWVTEKYFRRMQKERDLLAQEAANAAKVD
ncbi:hypothetical protein BV20DRAFT_976327 [Pilatotrama ljubarskyi]|nr:hypothetical protein BV20DRAFT_976327 [Pilatotrama ljubarskyi]